MTRPLRRRLQWCAMVVTVAVVAAIGLVVAGTAPVVAQTGVGVQNGGFESGSFSWWGRNRHTSIVTAARTGNFAAMVGSTSRSNGFSSVSQTFTTPAGGRVLSFWYNVTCTGNPANNFATANLQDNVTGTTTTVLPPVCSAGAGWQQVAAPVLPGRSYTLTLLNHDDHVAGAATYTLYDDVAVQGWSITHSANVASAAPGQTVTYTVSATNSGQDSLAPAQLSVNLAGVLDDATLTSGPSATSGSVSVVGQSLTWSGNLAPGATVTITYGVTVVREIGNRLMTSTVASTTAGSNCPVGAPAAACTVEVQITELLIEYVADRGSVAPGGLVGFTATFTNTGRTAYSGISVVSMAGESFDDVVPTGDQTASSGSLSVTPEGIVWTGNIPVGGVVTVTGTARAIDPPTGDGVIFGQLSTQAVGSNCPSGSTDPRCSVTVLVLEPELSVSVVAAPEVVAPGGVVTYTVTATNTGEYAYGVVPLRMDLSGALDEGPYNGDASAGFGGFEFDGQVLTWSGPLAVEESVTVTFSMTMDEDLAAGDRLALVVVSSTVAGSSCPPGSTAVACRASATVLTPALVVDKSADVSVVAAGGVVSYTVSVTNTGQVPFAQAEFVDDLSGVLDDAVFNDDAQADSGSVGLVDGSLVWSGSLGVGASAVVTYSVTTLPEPNGQELVNVVTSPTVGSNCPPDATDPRCAARTLVVVEGALLINAQTNVTSVVAGGAVAYTITVTNTTDALYSDAELSLDLADVLDDATLTSGPSASLGTVGLDGQVLTWGGDLPADTTVTITFTVTVDDPPAGDLELTAVAVSDSPGSNCEAASIDPRCLTNVTVSRLLIEYVADRGSVVPGGLVRLTATFTNTGRTAYSGISVVSMAGQSFDDVVPTGDQTASSGSLSVSAEGVVWTGSIPVGGVVTVTGTVRALDPPTGDGVVFGQLSTEAAGSNCPPGSTDPRCSITVLVVEPGLSVSVGVVPSTVAPGGVVTYTVTATNTGEFDYPSVPLEMDLSGALDDGFYNGDASAGFGGFEFDGQVLTWSGPLAVEESVTVTFSMTMDEDLSTGDRLALVVVSSTVAGSSCPPESSTAVCRASATVLTPALVVEKSADAPVVAAGGVVSYSVSVTNTGQVPFADAGFVDDLSGVLGDAVFNDDAQADSGSVGLVDGSLVWSGSLGVGASAVVTYSVTTLPEPNGQELVNVVTSPTLGSNCPPASTDPRCGATVELFTGELMITYTTPAPAVVEGSEVDYSVLLTNTGAAPLSGVSVEVDLAGILDSASFDGFLTSAGTVDLDLDPGQEALTWQGSIPAGEFVVVSFEVTVDRPVGGEPQLTSVATSTAPGSNCPPSEPDDPDCVTAVAIEAEFLALLDLDGEVTLSGLPGETVEHSEAVTMLVVTNSLFGFQAQVRAISPELTPATGGNPDTIPVSSIRVRETDEGAFQPLSASEPVQFHYQAFPTDPAGDPIYSDYEIAMPFVGQDTYTVTLEYLVMIP